MLPPLERERHPGKIWQPFLSVFLFNLYAEQAGNSDLLITIQTGTPRKHSDEITDRDWKLERKKEKKAVPAIELFLCRIALASKILYKL